MTSGLALTGTGAVPATVGAIAARRRGDRGLSGGCAVEAVSVFAGGAGFAGGAAVGATGRGIGGARDAEGIVVDGNAPAPVLLSRL
jgi:hypothetical protein